VVADPVFGTPIKSLAVDGEKLEGKIILLVSNDKVHLVIIEMI
jgi:hypothetical protein